MTPLETSATSIDPKIASSTTSSSSSNAAAVSADEPRRPARNQTATNPESSSSTCTPSLVPIEPRVGQIATSKLKREAAASDLNIVVNSITEMGLDWNEIARQQPLDPEFKLLRDNSRSGLNFMSTCIGNRNLIVDVSNGPARPYIPFASRRKVFDVFHGLGHPGVERTRQMIAAKVVWSSMRQDVTKWARECIQCQRAKVTKNTTPPIGEFQVPNRRFLHLNVDLITLPESNGFKYLLTAVDRFSCWPVAIPIVDMTAESVVDAFAHGWIQHFGIPATVTTDRGAQFTSDLFSQLTKTWGIKCITTTAYHPQSNGLVERFHRRLKEALIALGDESPQDWFWRLPCVLLSIRTTLKPDLGASPADLVYGEQLAVPGEVLPNNPVNDELMSRQRASALAALRVEVARLQPVPTSAHRKPLVHIPQELSSCTHVFVRRGGVQSTLASPYVGPFRVVDRNDVNFIIAVPGRPNETVSICRIKPCYSSFDDAEDAEPPPPPPRGRPPRPPSNPSPPRRNRRRRRLRRTGSDDEGVEDPQPNEAPHPPRTPPPEWRPPHWFAPNANPDEEEAEEAPLTPPSAAPSERWQSDDEYFGDADPPPTPPPMPARSPTDWFSPAPSVEADPTPPEPPAARRVSPPPPPPPEPPAARRVSPPLPPPPRARKRKVGNPNWVKGGTLAGSYTGDPNQRRRPRRDPEVPRSPQNEPTVRLFNRTTRRRPDVSTLQVILKDHFGHGGDASTSPSATDRSMDSCQGFFAPLKLDKSHADLSLEPQSAQ